MVLRASAHAVSTAAQTLWLARIARNPSGDFRCSRMDSSTESGI